MYGGEGNTTIHATEDTDILRVLKLRLYHWQLLKRRTDADAECTEDGRDGRIGATEYAEGNGTRKRGGDAEHIR